MVGKMTIFDYSKCRQCRHMRTQQNKETFNKILPEPIADIIQTFNCCRKCSRLISLEDDYDFDRFSERKPNNF